MTVLFNIVETTKVKSKEGIEFEIRLLKREHDWGIDNTLQMEPTFGYGSIGARKTYERIIDSYKLQGREMTKEERDLHEQVFHTEGFLMYNCKSCEEDFASKPENVKDGFCGICEIERQYEMKDSHGLENTFESEKDDDEIAEEMYDRYVFLTVKSIHVPLTDQEQSETEKIHKVLGIKVCDNCEGIGSKDFPSMTGSGWDHLTCSKCDGLGEINFPEELKLKLKKQILHFD